MSKIVSHDLNKLSDCKKYRDSVFRPIEKKKKKVYVYIWGTDTQFKAQHFHLARDFTKMVGSIFSVQQLLI